MSKIATRKTKLGNLLKSEFKPEHGYERKTLTVNVTAGMEIGAVVLNDGDGTYSLLAAEDADGVVDISDIAIVIDDSIYNLSSSELGDNDVACLVGGPGASGGAIVVKEQLKFADELDATEVGRVVAAIEALGIKVVTQV